MIALLKSLPWVYIIFTVVLGGGAAFMAGRGMATKWRPIWMTALYMLPLAFAVRFIHYALFFEVLTDPLLFLREAATLIAIALFGYQLTRAQQMTRQYPWLYERASLLTWRAKGPEVI